MSQENSTPEKSQEMRKRILLGVLGAVFVGVMYFQFFSGGDDPKGTKPLALNGVKPTPTATPAPPRVGGSPVPIVSQPLDLASMSNRGPSGDGVGRNIFIYPTPTPPPPVKLPPTPTPTPPPPITLFSVNPPGVIARTSEFILTVLGEKIPPDGKVYLSGREYPTTFVSVTQIKANVPADAIRNAGNLGIEVRSVSDAKLYSNQLSLNVAEPPPPPYRYIGLIVRKTGTTAVLKAQGGEEEVLNVSKDSKFGHWKVISITPQKVVLEDTNIKVTHTINFTGETG